MNRISHRILFLAACASLGVHACRDQAISPTCGRLEFLFAGIDGIGNSASRIGVLRAFSIRSGTDPASTSGQNFVCGYFVNGNGCTVDAGVVSVNGVEIPKTKVLQPNSTSPANAYLQNGASITFDGSIYSFSIAGSNEITGMTQPIVSPIGLTNITSHADGDTISRGNGVTLRWDRGAADTVMIDVTAASQAGDVSVPTFISNSGTYTMPASELVSLPDGPVSITVYRINYRIYEEPGWRNRNVLVMMYTAHRVELYLR